jgi:serine/threonine protein kinase
MNAARTELHEYACVYLALQLMAIVEAVHDAQFIHSDLKPDNFLITQS